MKRPLIIIHGWSDHSETFINLANLLQQKMGRELQLIDLGDYISMDDEVTYDDIVAALSNAWHQNNLPLTPASIDAIVHSTGGLVIRDWLSKNFTPETAPIKNLLMLAPANFGSPIAHKGRAFYGRIIKGFNSDKLFQVGEKLLKGLELASPYAWQLAMRDRFGQHNFYGPGKILCTVLVGDVGYQGISAAANEVGGDGTVRISTANLNCAYLTADFTQDPHNPSYTIKASNGDIAFTILDQENHATITGKDNSFRNPMSLDYMVKALEVTDDQFLAWCEQLQADTQTVTQKGAIPAFQNTVCWVRDQFNLHIDDYFLEFYNNQSNGGILSAIFHQDVINTTHAYEDDKSYRSLYMDCKLIYQQFKQNWENLQMSLTALPEFNQNKNVGYRTFTDEDIGSISIPREKIPEFFVAHRTLLVEIILRREQSSQVFNIHGM